MPKAKAKAAGAPKSKAKAKAKARCLFRVVFFGTVKTFYCHYYQNSFRLSVFQDVRAVFANVIATVVILGMDEYAGQ